MNNTLLDSNSVYGNEPDFSSNLEDYSAPQFTDYGDYGSMDNQKYMNTDNSYYPDNFETSGNSNPAMAYDNMNNVNSITNYNDPSIVTNNEPFPNPERMWNDFLSPNGESSIPEYESQDFPIDQNYPMDPQGYPDYAMPQDIKPNAPSIDSVPCGKPCGGSEYPVNQNYPIPSPEYQDYAVPQNIDSNSPFVEIDEYAVKPDHSFQPNFPNYGVPQNVEPYKPFDYPAPRPSYPDYGISQDIAYNPCNPCQWYDPCCYQNCIRICDQGML